MTNVRSPAVARPFRWFIGVDLGGGKGKKTAVAVLRRDDDGAVVTALAPAGKQPPLYDDALVALIGQHAVNDETLVAVDAPLTLPPCLRCEVPVCPGQATCIDPAVVEMRRLAHGAPESSRDHRRGKPQITPYTQRVTEVYLHRRLGLPPRETLGQGMGPLTARAAHLVRALAGRFRLHENLIEVFPRATLSMLGLDDNSRYKKHVERRLGILERLPDLSFGPGAWREACVQSDHVFDAVICAYTAYLYARDAWQLPAETAAVAAKDGWIWTPDVAVPEQEDAAPASGGRAYLP